MKTITHHLKQKIKHQKYLVFYPKAHTYVHTCKHTTHGWPVPHSCSPHLTWALHAKIKWEWKGGVRAIKAVADVWSYNVTLTCHGNSMHGEAMRCKRRVIRQIVLWASIGKAAKEHYLQYFPRVICDAISPNIALFFVNPIGWIV